LLWNISLQSDSFANIALPQFSLLFYPPASFHPLYCKIILFISTAYPKKTWVTIQI
jgi:hypothetical protein